MKQWCKKKKHEYSDVNLLKDVKVSEPEDYKNYMGIGSAAFNDFLKMVVPIISKKNPVLRERITTSTRPSLILRYLDFEGVPLSTRNCISLNYGSVG